ncbi:hypothetical protein PHISCL_03094 [Aspergillus sclerotialis]|uniref:Uncharacterized protein n=1 Tax=Aspergillus sclerotialis TaxID=2070753 RepID=A0A3A2ZQI3_9EURO|nr:hypothetical protein PHISCL_03094 [Aspergillus sclerotialis]
MAPALALSRGTSWVHESPYLPLGWEETNEIGSPSLKHSAMKRVLSDQRALTPEIFAAVPWHIANYLWDCLGRSKKRTFYMWKLFATAYPLQFREHSRYRSMKIEGPKMPMRDYFGLVRSESLRWRLALTLAVEFATVPELVEITTLTNLIALEIISPPFTQGILNDTELPVTMLNDRIIRTWSELARASKAFTHLQIMRLYHQKDLSTVALRYMKDFPSLRFIIVHNCQGITSKLSDNCTEINGWEIVAIPQLTKSTTLYGCYTTMKDLGEEGDQSVMDGDIPVLDFQIGHTIHRENKRIEARTQPICLKKCITSTETETEIPEPVTKKAKLNGERKQIDLDTRNKTRRSVMKDRKGRDLGGVLEELM